MTEILIAYYFDEQIPGIGRSYALDVPKSSIRIARSLSVNPVGRKNMEVAYGEQWKIGVI
ncbi:hypothetical protein ES703_68018 [subsurface metagenome]